MKTHVSFAHGPLCRRRLCRCTRCTTRKFLHQFQCKSCMQQYGAYRRTQMVLHQQIWCSLARRQHRPGAFCSRALYRFRFECRTMYYILLLLSTSALWLDEAKCYYIYFGKCNYDSFEPVKFEHVIWYGTMPLCIVHIMYPFIYRIQSSYEMSPSPPLDSPYDFMQMLEYYAVISEHVLRIFVLRISFAEMRSCLLA